MTDQWQSDPWQRSYNTDLYWANEEFAFLERGGVLPPGKSFRDLMVEFHNLLEETYGRPHSSLDINSAPNWVNAGPQAAPERPSRRVRRAAAKAEKRKKKH